MAAITDIVAAIVHEINTTEWSLPVVAQQSYRPRYDVATLEALRVTVVPHGIVIQSTSRGNDMVRYQVDAAIQRRVSGESPEEMEPLVGMVAEIAEHFRMWRVSGAVCTEIKIEPIYAIEHLDEFQCFTGVIRFIFADIVP